MAGLATSKAEAGPLRKDLGEEWELVEVADCQAVSCRNDEVLAEGARTTVGAGDAEAMVGVEEAGDGHD